MMVQRKRQIVIEKPLTAVELELMTIIWNLGECSVKDVQKALSKDRALAYTSVATFMKILEQKGFLGSCKNEKAHTYHPLLLKSDYEASALRHIAKGLFQGSPTSMVMRLLNDSELSHEELKSIRSLLDERLSL